MNCGYFYCPYDPETAFYRKGILTRYGKRPHDLSKIQNLADYRKILLERKNEK